MSTSEIRNHRITVVFLGYFLSVPEAGYGISFGITSVYETINDSVTWPLVSIGEKHIKTKFKRI